MRRNLVFGGCTLLLAVSFLSLALAAPKPTETTLPDPTGKRPTRPDPTGEKPTRPRPTTEERPTSEEKPTVPKKDDDNLKEDPYIHADFTKGNGTVEALLQELTKGNTYKEGRFSRALGCSATPLYGTTITGYAFVDFATTSPWPCGVDITQIKIRHGDWIDALQVTYKSYEGATIYKGQHGGNGGGLSVINLRPGERIIAVAGATDSQNPYGNVYVLQLTFVSKTESGEIKIYGPYGRIYNRVLTNSFMVVGKINSIFGRSDTSMRSIGFYYEAEGGHS